MAAKIYNWDDIKSRITCEDAATQLLGLHVSGGRCAATWRNGDNPSAVAFDGATWYDHKENKGGSVIDLVAAVRGCDIMEASIILGDHLQLPFRNPAPDPATRYSKLLRDGYQETERYNYTDAVGNLVMQVVRLEHQAKQKEFLQCDANGRWSVKHIDPLLYNLPGIINNQPLFIVEGEKDADTLIRAGVAATTNAGGADKWSPSFAQYFQDKDTFILRDNDESGMSHARTVAASIIGSARSVRILTTSHQPKGDVSDYFAEGFSVQQLFDLVNAAPVVTAEELAGVKVATEEDAELIAAKQANKQEFSNFSAMRKQVQGANGHAKTTVEKEARHISALIDETHQRFLGFPRKVGEQLFDHDRNSGQIFYFRKATQVFSWISRKSGQRVNWTRGDSMVSKEELYEGLSAEALRYESISAVPDWPTRPDVYYSHEALPEADPNFAYFNTLASYFNPSKGFEVALRALIAAPILYHRGIQRPMWVIDSGRPGSGKTTLANMIATLYGQPPIEVKKSELKKDPQKITERLVSRSGRLARMLLVDNVTGVFKSEELSGFITAPNISGKAPYGYGEETRPNNITYVVTANNASIDDDLSIRSYFVSLEPLENYRPGWASEVNDYIETNRLQIFADILAMINNHQPFEGIHPMTRCPEFETQIFQACCGGDVGRYSESIALMMKTRSEANIDEDLGKQVEDDFSAALRDLGINGDKDSAWIHSAVLEDWFRKAFPDMRASAKQTLFSLAKTGNCSRFDDKTQSWPANGNNRRRGMMWLNKEGCRKPSFIIRKVGNKVEANMT